MKHLAMVMVLTPLLAGVTACGSAGEDPQHGVKLKSHTGSASHQGYLGVGINDLRPSQARELKLSVKTGAIVNEVVDESPAAEAGLMENDVVIEFNKTTIDEASDLTKAVRATEPGTRASLTIIRKDQKKTLQVTVGSLPESHALARISEMPMPPMHVGIFGSNTVNGLSLMELNPQLGEYFGAPGGKGVLVEQVQKRSAAKEAGFRAGDVILRVGDEEVAEVGDVHEALDGLKEGDSVSVAVLRRGAQMTLRMEMDGAPANGFYFRNGGRTTPHGSSDMKVFQFDQMRLQKDLQKLQQELRSVGRDIRGKVEKLRNTVRRELRSVAS
jgi:predicted metalloprotease with PDZ domain